MAKFNQVVLRHSGYPIMILEDMRVIIMRMTLRTSIGTQSNFYSIFLS